MTLRLPLRWLALALLGAAVVGLGALLSCGLGQEPTWAQHAHLVLPAPLDDGGGYTLELQGTVDPAWPSVVIQQLSTIPVSAFDFVNESGLIVSPNSGEARP